MDNIYLKLFMAATAAFITCLLLVPLIIRFSVQLKMLDKPDERKVHSEPISRLGGIAIFFSAFCGVAFSLMLPGIISAQKVLYCCLGILFLTGIWDDLKNISPRLRFIIQLLCATALAASGIRLTSMYGVFGIHALNLPWQYIVTVAVVVGTTNAFNLIDGIDGLAAGLSMISLLVLLYIAWCFSMHGLMVLLTSFIIAVLGFLRFNISPAKIFMGDCGSLVLGFLISSVGILLIQHANANQHIIDPSRVAILVTSILVIPVFDTIRVFVFRIRAGQSPFSADKIHIHHLFLLAGLNHRKTSFTLYAFSILLIIVATVLPYATGISITIVAMVILFHCIVSLLLLNKAVEKWLVIIKKMERDEMG